MKKTCRLCKQPTQYDHQYCVDCWQGVSRWGGWLSDRRWNRRDFIQRNEYIIFMEDDVDDGGEVI